MRWRRPDSLTPSDRFHAKVLTESWDPEALECRARGRGRAGRSERWAWSDVEWAGPARQSSKRSLDKAVGGGVSCVSDKKLHYQRSTPAAMEYSSRILVGYPAAGWGPLMLGLAKQSP